MRPESETDSPRPALEPPVSIKGADAATDIVAPDGNGVAPLPPNIPDCEILAMLGRGGSGVIYRAKQISLDRVVAVKVPAVAAFLPDSEAAGRFLTEARAVARLSHPHIVSIYEVGVAGTAPYFLTEYMSGGSLDRRLAGKPMAARDAASLVETLARAAEFAHLKGIDHRDLKPANVLLTADGTPKISDFGLARLFERDSRQTNAGANVGTPSYMAPEQARGVTKKTGPATDIYALGVLLYELLTGRPPFLAENPLDTLTQVLSSDPIPPRQLQPRLPRDLETICLKCLEKSPAKRYERACDLADDLHRFLGGEPIEARPPAFWKRGLKWARRHRAAATLLVLSALAAAALVGQSISRNREMANLTRELEKETEATRLQSTRADQNLHDALAVIDLMLTRVGRDELANMPHMEQLQRRLLEDALEFHKRFMNRNEHNPAAEVEMASSVVETADINRRLGNSTEAEKFFDMGKRMLGALQQKQPHLRRPREDAARLALSEGLFLTDADRLDEAGVGLALARDTYSGLRNEFPREPQFVEHLARVHSSLGSLALRRERLDEAREQYGTSLELLEMLPADRARSQDVSLQKAAVYNNLASVDQSAGKPADARKELELSLAIYKSLESRLRGERDLRWEMGQAQSNLGAALAALGETEAAEIAYREAIRLIEGLAGDYRTVAVFRRKLGGCYKGLADVLRKLGKDDEAAAAERELKRFE